MSEPFLPRPLRLAGRVFAWVLGALLLVAIALAVWLGVRGGLAYGHLTAAQERATGLAGQLDDIGGAVESIDALGRDTSAAQELTSDPIWNAAEGLPWVGPQLAAVGTVADTIDRVVTDAASPIAAVAGDFGAGAFVPVDGRIDTAVFAALEDPAWQAADVTASARDDLATLDRTALIGLVDDAVADVDTLLNQAATATDALARTSTLLPSMLGADGARDHLLLVQNNAEWRSQGGIVGAATLLQTDAGEIELGSQLSSDDFDTYAEPVLDLGDYETIYQKKPGRFIQNITQVPDFAFTGQLGREFAKRAGEEITSVVSLDPVALSYLLEATGPVALPTGEELTSDNAVDLLLSEVYTRSDNPAFQDAFFAAAAASVFDALTGGDVDPAKLVAGLGRAGTEHRLLLWSADEAEQQLIAETTLAGAIPTSDDDTARLGVYFNEGGGSKMDYYVTPDVALNWSGCAEVSTPRTLTLDITLTSDAPADAATSLPEYVTAYGIFGVPAGIARTVGEVYLPEGFEVVGTVNGDGGGFGGGMVDGRQVLTYTVDLDPGETKTVTIAVRADTDITDAEAWVTPTADSSVSPSVQASCGAR
ncbi:MULTISPECIES: DUF4012 domain-containing protein [unclassified Microbacterium]|uniref:DUF4012 domain-containing protein n=1 Tax=unclassified Microbacterium TaxID=2609290 RepID=UPI003862F974